MWVQNCSGRNPRAQPDSTGKRTGRLVAGLEWQFFDRETMCCINTCILSQVSKSLAFGGDHGALHDTPAEVQFFGQLERLSVFSEPKIVS